MSANEGSQPDPKALAESLSAALAKPTLATIEAKLVDDYLSECARMMCGARDQLLRSMPALAWKPSQQLVDLIFEKLFSAPQSSFHYYDLRKTLSPDDLKKISERVCGDFLRKVDEIQDIANEAASRED